MRRSAAERAAALRSSNRRRSNTNLKDFMAIEYSGILQIQMSAGSGCGFVPEVDLLAIGFSILCDSRACVADRDYVSMIRTAASTKNR